MTSNDPDAEDDFEELDSKCLGSNMKSSSDSSSKVGSFSLSSIKESGPALCSLTSPSRGVEPGGGKKSSQRGQE